MYKRQARHRQHDPSGNEEHRLDQLLQLDLDVHASGELEAHQSLDRLVGRLQNVDQTLMSAALELLAAILVLSLIHI